MAFAAFDDSANKVCEGDEIAGRIGGYEISEESPQQWRRKDFDPHLKKKKAIQISIITRFLNYARSF